MVALMALPNAALAQSGAAQSGRDSSDMQMIGAVANVGAGVMYTQIAASGCTGATSWGCWAIPMIGLAAQMASLQGSSSGQSGGAGLEMSNYDWRVPDISVPAYTTPEYKFNPDGSPIVTSNSTDTGPGNTTNGLTPDDKPTAQGLGGLIPPGTTPQTIARDVAKLKADLAKSGATLSADGKTLTTKDGRKFDLEKGKGGSKNDLVAMGLSPSEADSAVAASSKYGKQMAAKFEQARLAMANRDPAAGGGGAGGGLSSGGGGGGAGGYSYNANPKARAKPKLSGLTKKLGDDTIGVSGDDIFEMITRRYKARDDGGNFIKDK